MGAWIALAAAAAYVGGLFAIAFHGDRVARTSPARPRPLRYALAISVYCTSWTFFGSVGLASRSGLDFLAIYIGPILAFTLGYPLLRRVADLSRAERITSVADFLSARYGKNQRVAVVATLVAVVGVVPYIALQLKAVAASLVALAPLPTASVPLIGDPALLTAAALAVFAILFGTRQTDATEHQDGMVLAVAAEAVVKLVAFLFVGAYVTFVLAGGPAELLARAAADPAIIAVYTAPVDLPLIAAMTVLSFSAAFLLPRQFHMTIVEMNDPQELKRARWLFPLYLVAINLFVVPIAVAGTLMLPPGVDADLFVLELPHQAGAPLVTLAAFLGGLSAATAMVIVASVALSIMISNEIVVPALVRRRSRHGRQPEMTRLILTVRRFVIVVVMALGYLYYRFAGTGALASIGLLSFAAIAQLAPAFFGGLLWRRATAAGAIAGIVAGFLVWAYTLLLPTAPGLAPEIVSSGPFGIAGLRPASFLSVTGNAFANGVFWSLLLNTLAFVAASLARSATPIERLQATIFAPPAPPQQQGWSPIRATVTVGELAETVGRYLGAERTARALERFFATRGLRPHADAPADPGTIRHCEQLLASAIGAASSRLVLSLLLSRGTPTSRAASRLLDDAADALRYNRDLLQSVLDQVDQGIAVFDADLKLVSWNRPFRRHLGLAPEYGHFGTTLKDIVGALARQGLFGDGDPEDRADERMTAFVERLEASRHRHPLSGRVLAVAPARLTTAGIAFTVTDVTAEVESARALERANATLEKRVEERTAELVRVNAALERATAAAEEANIGKTRFIAAAGHDILQPLNAARLYASALAERMAGNASAPLAADLGLALDAAEDIFKAVLELSRLDAGQWRPEPGEVRLDALFERIRAEFGPLAADTGRTLRIVPSGLAVATDPNLLGRLVRNLVSNAIKYNHAGGRVLVGCRRRPGGLVVEVVDTGLGIRAEDRQAVFEEFRRLDAGARAAQGLGLGLSIVERIARVLGLAVEIDSVVGRGTRFSVKGLRVVAAATTLPLPGEAPAPPRGLIAGLDVVAIDNDPRIRDGMAALIGGWGCRVVAAADPRAALHAIREAGLSPDILLVDYHLDEGDGFLAIAEVRARLGRDVPAVLVTADRSREVRAAAAARGVQVLNKPVKPAALRALMTQWSARADRGREAAE